MVEIDLVKGTRSGNAISKQGLTSAFLRYSNRIEGIDYEELKNIRIFFSLGCIMSGILSLFSHFLKIQDFFAVHCNNNFCINLSYLFYYKAETGNKTA